MELTLKILKVNTLGRKNDQTLQAHLLTDMLGILNADINILLKRMSLEEFYRLPGCMQAIARFYRNKNYEALPEFEKRLIDNIPKDLEDEFLTCAKACIIMELLSIEIGANYSYFRRMFKKKQIMLCANSQTTDMTQQEIKLYKKLKYRLNLLKDSDTRKTRLNKRKIETIEEFLSFFDSGVALMAELGE